MKNAVITGATKGLGRAIAEALAVEGYQLWITARTIDDLQATKSDIENRHKTHVSIHQVDFCQMAEVDQFAQHLLTSGVQFQVLVNNAGAYLTDNISEGVQHFEANMAINFESAYRLTQALVPQFIEQKFGQIITVCSAVNRAPREDAASYTISKFALYGYHKVLHSTLQKHGVKVTALFPASMATASWDGINAPKEKFIQPEDVAALVAMLLNMKPGTVFKEIDIAAAHPDY